jgi:uncharacterized protein YukE
MGDLAPPRTYVVRKPSGDPHAARRLASAYDELAAAVRDETRTSAAVLDALTPLWRGVGARATQSPAQVLAADGARVAHGMHATADDLRHYAHRLLKAHEHHGWSLGKLVAVGAIVTVGAAAVVVTMGAAAPAEAAAAAAAVEGAEVAADAATAASTGAAGALSAWQGALAAVRPLLPFVVPHLMSAGGSVAVDAVSQLLASHHVDLHSLEVAAAVGFAGSSTGGVVERRLATHGSLLRRAAESGAWAASGTVGAYADEGHVDPLDSVADAMTGFVARDIRRGVDWSSDVWKLPRR